MRVLGIETSCDETGIAIYAANDIDNINNNVNVNNKNTGNNSNGCLIANILHSQIPLHAKFGGVVPELASRDHIRKTLPLIQEALTEANITLRDLDAIAYTAGPGLAGALLVGAAIGQSLGFALDIPTIAVHHMEAHLLAAFLDEHHSREYINKAKDIAEADEKKVPQKPLHFPFIALLVSGGHTQLVRVDDIGKYELIGETLDDAAGEAFDKVAKILGLPYPGGVALAALATSGNSSRFHFPRPMINRSGLDFSFSGLKTFALNTLRNTAVKENNEDQQTHADIACAFQDAIVDTLAIKCLRALQQTQLKQLVLAGGVSANQALRTKLHEMAQQHGFSLYYPHPKFCTDNGAMVAYAGYCHFMRSEKNSNFAIEIFPRWSMAKEKTAKEKT